MAFFPTNHYPGIYWPTSRQVEAGLPVTAAPPAFGAVVSEAIGASGIRVAQFVRAEEQRQLTFFGVDPIETVQWGQFFSERGGRGQQAELLMDRFTGSIITFNNTYADQNFSGDVSWLQSAVSSYVTVNGKIGLITNSAGGYLSIATNATSANAALTDSGTTIVLTVIASFAGNDGVRHHLLVLGKVGTNAGIRFIKFEDNTFKAQMATTSGLVGAYEVGVSSVGWPSGTVVSTILQYMDTGQQSMTLQIFLTMSGQSTVALSSTTQAGSTNQAGTWDTPTEIGIQGGTQEGGTAWQGILLHFATYKKAYADPTILLSHFPLGRNYYSKAELAERTFNPQRISPGVDLWQWTWTVRQGA